MAEPVQEKIRTNFCEWFQTGVQAAAGSGKPVAPAREALDALFGGPEGKAPDTPSRTALDDLFGD